MGISRPPSKVVLSPCDRSNEDRGISARLVWLNWCVGRAMFEFLDSRSVIWVQELYTVSDRFFVFLLDIGVFVVEGAELEERVIGRMF